METLVDKVRCEIVLRNGLTINEIANEFLGIKKESPANGKFVEIIFKGCSDFYFDGEKWQIKKIWRKAQFGIEDFEKEPQSFGVFGFYDEDKKIIFVGSATNLREKLLSLDMENLYESAVSYIVSLCDDEKAAQDTEQKLIAKHKPILNQ